MQNVYIPLFPIFHNMSGYEKGDQISLPIETTATIMKLLHTEVAYAIPEWFERVLNAHLKNPVLASSAPYHEKIWQHKLYVERGTEGDYNGTGVIIVRLNGGFCDMYEVKYSTWCA